MSTPSLHQQQKKPNTPPTMQRIAIDIPKKPEPKMPKIPRVRSFNIRHNGAHPVWRNSNRDQFSALGSKMGRTSDNEQNAHKLKDKPKVAVRT